MNETVNRPELDEIIRQSYGVPEIRPEFIKSVRHDLMKRAAQKSTSNPRRSLRLSFGLGLAAALLLLGLIFGQMPEGQALAESIKHFFKITTQTEIPLTNPSDFAIPTYAPTFSVTLAPAVIAVPTKTPLPTPEGFTLDDTQACQTDPHGYRCKIAWAEKKVGFEIKEFPADPQDMRFEELHVEESKFVYISYVRVSGGSLLYLIQGPDLGYTKYGVGVPAEHVQQVMVGEYPGEYVAGGFGIGPGETSYSWKSGGKYSLRWSDGEREFEITSYGCSGGRDCTAEELTELALSLVDEPVPSGALRADHLKSIEEAEQISGLTLLEPKMLPEGFSFHHGTYDAELGEVKLYYSASGYELGAVSIILRQIPADQFWKNSGETWEEFSGKAVDVNGQPGDYQSSGENSYSLLWQNRNMVIVLDVVSTEWYGGTFTEEQILEIARSVK